MKRKLKTSKSSKKNAKWSDTKMDNWRQGNISITISPNQSVAQEMQVISDSESPELNERKIAEYIEVPHGVLIILPKNAMIHFYGLTQLKVLYGEIEVFGHWLDTHSPSIKVYSSRGSSLFYMQNINPQFQSKVVPINSLIPQFNLDMNISTQCSIVYSMKLNEPKILFIEKHTEQYIFPQLHENIHRCIFEPKNHNLLYVNPHWDEVIEEISGASRVMYCGGKGVGKSTFLRYSINRLLMKFPKIRIIDLDPGQSEFTVPGSISTLIVDKPVFGVNFTHLKKTEISYLTNINVANEPLNYIKNIQHLVSNLKNEENIPILINYMGYTAGFGLNIASAAISVAQPTIVIQIYGAKHTKNFSSPLNYSVVEKNAVLLGDFKTNLNYELIEVNSFSDDIKGWSLLPRQVREMSVLAYFSRMIEAENLSILHVKSSIYELHLSKFNITNSKNETIPLAVINANLVALCKKVSTENPIFQCFGWGIVRGYDENKDLLVLLTPEPLSLIEEIDYLVYNDMSLPPSLYMTSDGIKGVIPYVNEGELINLGQKPKRSYISAK